MSPPISLIFPDSSCRTFPAGITAAEVAHDIAPSLAKKAISAQFNESHWDLTWPLTTDGNIRIHTMSDEAPALELIRHSLAHIMARAVQDIWPETRVTIGPVIAHGWYYDFDREQPFTPEDLTQITARMKQIINLRDPVHNEVWERTRALRHYEEKGEPYKIELVQAIPDDVPIRMYWHGDWQDLCRGPHLKHTGQVSADGFSLSGVAGAYWRGDSRNKMLQRIYGVGFRRRQDLQQHLRMLEEARKRDHRRIGTEMKLFHFQEEAPGMAFWHPHGWCIYKTLRDYMARRQTERGYVEVNTPALVDRALWEQSGHWEKFRENMFVVEVDRNRGEDDKHNALKPMNCPCHVQIYNKGQKSYRDLPLRMAEFGSCSRFEPSGALHGLMRVRGFVQDDAHIFCTESQIESETTAFIDMLSQIYADLGFDSFQVKFADRPPNRAGADHVWDRAESALTSAAETAGCQYELNPGEGAFYGPKLEFVLTDAIGRDWQCGTLQVDFVLPERLNATYIGRDGEKHRPVMLHRAILGSFERFIGILIENYAGRFPLWLAPNQIVVATIVSDADSYAQEVTDRLRAAGLRATKDSRNEKIKFKIREHSLAKVPIILALGGREVQTGEVSVRRLGDQRVVSRDLDSLIKELVAEAAPPDQQNRAS